MGLSDLFASNLIIQWLRGDANPHELTVTMSGLQRGDRVVQLGGDPTCVAALAGKTGLSGRAAYAATRAEAVAQADGVAAKAGVLVETAMAGDDRLPFDSDSFDLAVIDDPARTTGDGGALLMRETLRILREGGRCLIVVTLGPKQAQLTPAQLESEPSVSQALAPLKTHGFRGARLLVAREGRAYIEAAKPRASSQPPSA